MLDSGLHGRSHALRVRNPFRNVREDHVYVRILFFKSLLERTTMEKYETKKLIQQMASLYPSFRWNGDTVELWHAALEPYEYKKAYEALISLVRKVDYIPNVGTIIKELLKTPDFELLEFKRPNGAMYTVKVYTKDETLEDQVFTFNYRTKEEAVKMLNDLKRTPGYYDILEKWKAQWFNDLLRGDDQ